MRAKYELLFLAAAMMLFAGSADAALWKFNVFIDGLQEIPPVATPGSGTAEVFFDDATGVMDVNGTFQDLIGTTTDAHVHGYAPVGTPAGIVFGLTIPLGVHSGTVSGSGVIPSDRIDDVLAGLTYINIHSTFRPGGEIRGQIFPPILVPEPASGLLLAAGGGLFLLRRRSRG